MPEKKCLRVSLEGDGRPLYKTFQYEEDGPTVYIYLGFSYDPMSMSASSKPNICLLFQQLELTFQQVKTLLIRTGFVMCYSSLAASLANQRLLIERGIGSRQTHGDVLVPSI